MIAEEELRALSLDDLAKGLAKDIPTSGAYHIYNAEFVRRQTAAQLQAMQAQKEAAIAAAETAKSVAEIAGAATDAAKSVAETARATYKIAKYTLIVAIATGFGVRCYWLFILALTKIQLIKPCVNWTA